MKTNYKKLLKFATLLITSIIIGTASASAYRYMYLQGTISVGPAPSMVWIDGEDADFTIAGSTASGTLSVEAINYPMNFTRAIYLKNVGSTTFNYNITVLQALSSNDFSEAKIHIYGNYTSPPNWNYLGTINLLSPTSFYQNSLAAGKYIRFTVEVNATTTNGGTFKIQVAYWP